jgi:hypothetical protein
MGSKSFNSSGKCNVFYVASSASFRTVAFHASVTGSPTRMVRSANGDPDIAKVIKSSKVEWQ